MVTLALAKYLVERDLVSPQEMDDALQHQVLYGGGLDTCLLELDLTSEQVLTEALAEVLGVPPATPALLAMRDPRTANLLPALLAAKYQLLPVVMRGRKLFAVIGSGLPSGASEEVGFMLSLQVEVHAICEARFMGLMQEWMNTEVAPRFEPLLERLGPFAVRPGRLGEGLLGEARAPATPVPMLRDDRLADALTAAREAEGKQETIRTGRISAQDAAEACLHAEHRDDIVDIALRFARQFMPFVGIFVVQDDKVYGWDAVGTEDASERIKQVRLPIAGPSVVRTVVDTGSYYLGKVPESIEGNRDLLLAMGRPEPENALVVPILLHDRVIGLLFGDARTRFINADRVGELLLFISRLSDVFERLIQRSKQAALTTHPIETDENQ